MTAPEDQNGLREALASGVEAGIRPTITRLCDEIKRLRAERDEAIEAKAREVASVGLHDNAKWLLASKDLWHDRARAAEAEITRLKEGMEGLKAKAEGQIAYWRERQAAEKCLEDGVSEDGETYTPMGDHAAWQGGYCNGRMSEADWWRWTLVGFATLSPKEQPRG